MTINNLPSYKFIYENINAILSGKKKNEEQKQQQ